jgi:hypothetical protein
LIPLPQEYHFHDELNHYGWPRDNPGGGTSKSTGYLTAGISSATLICNLGVKTTTEHLLWLATAFDRTTVLIGSQEAWKRQTDLLRSLASFPDVRLIFLPERMTLPIEKPLFPREEWKELEETAIAEHAQQLLSEGYTVIPALSPEELKFYHGAV